MPCLLLNLPSEIIESIICLSSSKPYSETDFLGWQYPEHNYTHLEAIALSCQRLYKLCAPFLWKHKEFILPRVNDIRASESIRMATDLLSTPAALSPDHVLGNHVCSLYRDLTSGPHFDLANSKLMAGLVTNLKALRIDFHPLPRADHYGLVYFLAACPHLTELFISHCQDTFDDFDTLCQYKPKLISLTLISCTIKQKTLENIIQLFHPTLKKFLFRQVLIEPTNIQQKTNAHNMSLQLGSMHPLHYQHIGVSAIPQTIYLESIHHLTQLALTDSISYDTLEHIVNVSPKLEKLAIVLHDYYPQEIASSVIALTYLDKMQVLSIAFRKYYPISREFERIPCHAPSHVWSLLVNSMPKLRSLYISTSRMLVSVDFIPKLLDMHPYLENVMIYSIAFTTLNWQKKNSLRYMYLEECKFVTFNICKEYQKYLYTRQEAIEKNFARIMDDVSDVQLCFAKGYN
ncbi:hypothetical protein BY458DRAFT_163060 [Sporodiniella umbellata]|nr:hypothetical protein BY458DRAFT_163060 [Sporodiniella umbellata]